MFIIPNHHPLKKNRINLKQHIDKKQIKWYPNYIKKTKFLNGEINEKK